MELSCVLLLAVVAFGVAVYAIVRRRAVVAALAAPVVLLHGVVWAGETFGFLNV